MKPIITSSTSANRSKDSIPKRIEFIKELLRGKKIKSLVNFDTTDTECYVYRGGSSKYKHGDDNSSSKSGDTRVALGKMNYPFEKFISQMNAKLVYVKSGSTGHTFKGEAVINDKTYYYAVKVVAYPKKRYGDITDIRRPENAEIMIIKLLSYFVVKSETPHIVLPIATFDTDITPFITLGEKSIDSGINDKYEEFLNNYKKGKFYDTVSVLISEWANRGDLLDFIRERYQSMSPHHWKVFIFQILSVLAVIQTKYPSFRHNDLKANNILVQKTSSFNNREFLNYRVAGTLFRVPNLEYEIKLWDFDFACIPGVVDNDKVNADWTREINVTPVQNRYYDVHYFFNTLINKSFCGKIIDSEYCDEELRAFISRVLPRRYRGNNVTINGVQYVSERGRILVNHEYTTPAELLRTDPYFEEFRVAEPLRREISILDLVGDISVKRSRSRSKIDSSKQSSSGGQPRKQSRKEEDKRERKNSRRQSRKSSRKSQLKNRKDDSILNQLKKIGLE